MITLRGSESYRCFKVEQQLQKHERTSEVRLRLLSDSEEQCTAHLYCSARISDTMMTTDKPHITRAFYTAVVAPVRLGGR